MSLLTTIGWSNTPKPNRKLRPDTLNTTLFLNLLRSSIDQVAPSPNPLSIDDLDKLATDITQAIRIAYSGAARRSLGQGK